MPLTLSIRNVPNLTNGSPLSLVLDRRGATIGRDPTSDWCLPDPSLHISSRHCEIAFQDGHYVLNDISTNGTFLNGEAARLPGLHAIRQGDVFSIGHFEIVAALDEQTASAMAARNAQPAQPAWGGWNSVSDATAPAPAPPAQSAKWDAPPPAAAISGTGPMSQSWAAPAAEPMLTNQQGASTWGAPPPPPAPASGWSSPVAATPPPPPVDDVWGRIAASNVVDWARGGFGEAQNAASPFAAPPPAPIMPPPQPGYAPVHAAEPVMPSAPAAPAAAPGRPPLPVSASMPPPPAANAPAAPASGAAELVQALGLAPQDIRSSEADFVAQAGHVLRRVVAGLVVMLEARARAKSQLGAQGTSLEFDGNNPLKFARTPEQALAQLLNPAERGFMSADKAIEDSFRDLQAHQLATLKAMQGALRATLDRFSPNAIRSRAKSAGLLAKILPGSRDATLWQTYEREFSGVAQGSDEAFMDVFAKEFRKAYEEVASGR
jgi:type VI secretion system FHA domain protein